MAVNRDFINFVERKNCNSWQVPGGGTAALPVLRSIHPGAEAQAYFVGKLVLANLRDVIKDSSCSWLPYTLPSAKLNRDSANCLHTRSHIVQKYITPVCRRVSLKVGM